MLAAGHPNHEIAETLLISQGTVRHHISSILDKLQVDNRVQAAVRAVSEVWCRRGGVDSDASAPATERSDARAAMLVAAGLAVGALGPRRGRRP